ncbi:MAG: class I SAM-dependent methyltransferase [Anaerolineales bacterium]|nr:class I SAM-dependent methyltransferase [Anaerolineales bacterium]
MNNDPVKQQVSEFYNRVGWQEEAEGIYQNAAYEDLRPVAQEYIRRCHLRVLRHIKPAGRLLLDAGSGPVQYAEYLEYSRGYQKRVCADISVVALQEARKRIGDASSGGHGLFVVADIANLPFKAGCFDGAVSLHTIHHLPLDEHVRAYQEIERVLASGCSAAVVNGWDAAPLASLTSGLARMISRLRRKARAANHKAGDAQKPTAKAKKHAPAPTRTYVRKHNAAWLEQEVGALMPVQIWTWRSVNVNFLRTFIHRRLGGRTLLRFLYWLEERFPHFFGKNGQYPLIVIQKRGEA